MSNMKATTRTESGSKAAKRLRAGGKVPGIVYGHGQEAVRVALDAHEVEMAVHHHERLLEIDVEGKNETVMVKEIQYDTMGDRILHIDLFRVNLDERVSIAVPIKLVGTPAGVHEGGSLQQIVTEVNIEVAVRNMPDEIRASVESLNIGGHLYAKDLAMPEGAVLLDDENEVLVTVLAPVHETEAAPAAEGEAPAEPEVIGEKKEEPAEE